jgi:hypothetical protein
MGENNVFKRSGSPSSGSNSGLVEKTFNTLYGSYSFFPALHDYISSYLACLSFSACSASSFDCFAISYRSHSLALALPQTVVSLSLPLGCYIIRVLLLDLRLCGYLFLL